MKSSNIIHRDPLNPKFWNSLARYFRKRAAFYEKHKKRPKNGQNCICYVVAQRIYNNIYIGLPENIEKLIQSQRPNQTFVKYIFWNYDTDGFMNRSRACDRIATQLRKNPIE